MNLCFLADSSLSFLVWMLYFVLPGAREEMQSTKSCCWPFLTLGQTNLFVLRAHRHSIFLKLKLKYHTKKEKYIFELMWSMLSLRNQQKNFVCFTCLFSPNISSIYQIYSISSQKLLKHLYILNFISKNIHIFIFIVPACVYFFLFCPESK